MSEQINFRHLSAYQEPDDSLGYLLWRVSIKWRSAIESVLKKMELTHPQFVVMATLGWLTKDGVKISQVDIGRMAGLDPNTTSQILRGLEAKEIIKRTRQVDERSKTPVLTTLGADLLKKALPAVEQADLEFFACIKSVDEKKLIELFKTLLDL